MRVNPKIEDSVSKVFDGHPLTRDEILYLLGVNQTSLDAGFIMAAANAINRAVSRRKGSA